jgi:hypothetical protein
MVYASGCRCRIEDLHRQDSDGNPIATWLDIVSLTAAEVARVQRLEKVAEAARALRSEHRADFMDDGARQDRLYELFQLLDESDEAAALAEIDAGEGDDE